VKINGFTFDYSDTALGLNSGGVDGECKGTNESQAWEQIGGKGGPVNIPLPPAMTIALQAAPSTGHVVGQSQAFTVAAMDAAGRTVPNVAVELGVFGANPQQLSGTTDVNGTATFSYIGTNAGTDTVTATAIISGLRTVSNAVPIQWTIPAPGGPTGSTSGPAPPSIIVTSPADGSAVSQRVSITATIRAPPSSPINSWSVLSQSVSGSSFVTLASGTSNLPATLAMFDPTGLAAGTYAITVNATTSAGGSASAIVRVIVGNGGGTTAQAPPSISAPSPADGSIITKPVPVSATFTPPAGQTIASWSVSYQAGFGPVVLIASGSGVPPSPLTTFDPTLLANDTYAITVAATASAGGVQTATTTVAVSGNLKLGRYTTTYQDLSVPVNGFQMQVRRTYDSTDKRVGDFGIGWHVDLSNFRISANRQLGAGGWTEYPTSCVFGLCFYGFKTTTAHFMTVTYPDQHQEIFDFAPLGGAGLLYFQGTAAFTARAGTGTTSALEALDTGLNNGFDGNLYGAGGFYNPTRFKLTTRDGRVFVLDTVLGLVSETDRNGNSLTVDSAGVHASNGQSITFTRDSQGRINQIVGPSGETLNYTYSATGDLASSTDPNGNAVSYTYNASHDLLSATGPGATKPFEQDQYDSAGRLIAITDGNGNTTHLSTNVGAQQQVLADPLGQLHDVLTYDNLGGLLQRDEIFGGKTVTEKWTYDSAGRTLSHTDPLGHSVSAVYDAAGNLVQVTDAGGNTFKYTYNTYGQQTSVIGPGGTVLESRAYDAGGNLAQVKRVDGATSSFQHDAQGNLTQVTDPLNHSTQLTYDANGHLAKVIDAASNATSFSVDASGRAVSITDATRATTHYTYDASGNLTGVTDANNNSWAAQYNFRGNIVSVKDPLGHSKTYVYDAVFQPIQITDRNGQVTTYGYDADGQMVKKTLPGGDVTTFTLDPLGRLIDATNSSGDITMTYDDAGRLISQSTTGSGVSVQPTVTLNYGYDAKGNRTSMSGPDGTTAYAFNAFSELTSLTDSSGGLYQFGYDATLHLTTIVRPNGVVDQLSYDSVGDLVSRTSTKGGATLSSDGYVFDATGHRSSQTDLSGTTTFTHDAGGQLTGATPPGGAGAQSFTYDGAGNRISATGIPSSSVRYDANNHLLSYGPATYSYDNEGNVFKKTDASGTTTYTWNPDHRLVSIQNPDLSAVTYRYDPLGRRIEVQSPSQDTRYAYDGENIHLEYNGANLLQASYTDGSGVDSVLGMSRGGSSYYYSVDGLNSTTALTDATGTVVQRYSYDAVGHQTQTGGLTNPFTYTGRELDSSGLYYMRARYYDPGIGRFVSEDPHTAVNLYPYAANDPVDFADPSGTQAFVENAIKGAISGAIFSAASQVLVQLVAMAVFHCSFNVGAFIQAVVLGALAGGLFGAGAAGVSLWLFRALFGGMLGLATAGIQIALDAAGGKPDTPEQQTALLASGFALGAFGGAISNINIFNFGRNPVGAAVSSSTHGFGNDMQQGTAGFLGSQVPSDLFGTFLKGAAGC
jgi:RHS repeat-associated protein